MIALMIIFFIFETAGVWFPKQLFKWSHDHINGRFVIDVFYFILTVMMIFSGEYAFHGLLIMLVSSVNDALDESKINNHSWYRADSLACAIILLHALQSY